MIVERDIHTGDRPFDRRIVATGIRYPAEAHLFIQALMDNQSISETSFFIVEHDHYKLHDGDTFELGDVLQVIK